VTTDEGFREIQLNGKQLVFLFMAATVVSVVIFLCGVLVGRGVRPDRPAPAEATSAAVAPDPVAAPTDKAPVTPPRPAGEPPAPADELSYYDRLQKNEPPHETLKASAPRPAAPPAARPPATTKPLTPDAPPASWSAGEPSGPGFAVQVTTQPDREAADTLVKRLITKGYPAYVAGPVSSGGRSIFRIRVGKYKTAKEAEAVSKRLEAEDQFKFKPWIAR
jgi:DedD protein